MLRFLEIALQPKVYRTALKVGLLVGTILALINHSSAVFSLSLSAQNILQIILSYLIPYSVSTYSSVKIILSNDH
jgi:hypothetical protein